MFQQTIRNLIDLFTGGDPTCPILRTAAETRTGCDVARTLSAVRDYLVAVFVDGDWLNDWATHIPGVWATAVKLVGFLIAVFVR